MSNLFVGRQPIYDRDLQVVGYELLYRRDSLVNRAVISDVDQACSQVLLDTIVEVGIENMVGEHLAFFNLTRSFLVGNYEIPIPHKQVVVEILEDVAVDDKLMETVERMKGQGLTIALDDFVYRKELKPLLDRVHIVKVDLPQLSRHELAEHVTLLKHRGVRLLAEKVETYEEFEVCRAMGFDYFQGYFFCKPRILQQSYIPTNRLAVIELLSKIQSPDVRFSDLSHIIRRDVSLSYKILRLINSAYYALPRKINSIEESLVFLGLNTLSNLVTLIKLARIEDKPPELTVTAMIRGRMCECLATRLGGRDTHPYFTAGLFSALDALLDRPMEEVLSLLPLSDEINRALTAHEGPIGQVLDAVLAYEQADWERAVVPGLDDEAVRAAYFDAIAWADQLHKSIRDSGK